MADNVNLNSSLATQWEVNRLTTMGSVGELRDLFETRGLSVKAALAAADKALKKINELNQLLKSAGQATSPEATASKGTWQQIVEGLNSLVQGLKEAVGLSDPKAQEQLDKASEKLSGGGELDAKQVAELVSTLNAVLAEAYRMVNEFIVLLKNAPDQISAASKQDAQQLRAKFEEVQQALDQAAQNLAAQDEASHAGVKVVREKVEIFSDEPSLKQLVSIFRLYVGEPSDEARKANPYVKMGSTPGAGLPPVGTP